MKSLQELPVKNLRGNAGRTVATMLFSALIAVAVFGGVMVVLGVQEGLGTVQRRLGADLVVTPADAPKEFNAQTALVQAEPNYFYMDASKLDEVAAIEGVAQTTSQLFMASAKASCCSAKLQIIAFDPATDFVVLPWIQTSFGTSELGDFDIVVGSNVTVYDDYIIRLYDNDCRVVGQFAPTGSTMDNAVYMNFSTVRALIESSFEKGLNKYERYDPDKVISSVLVKVEDGRDPEEVARAIEQRVQGVNVTTSSSMVASVGDGLEGVSGMVWAFVVIFVLIGLVMTVLVFALAIHARRREFATMRVAGASKSLVRRVVVREALVSCACGGLFGVAIAAVLLYAFAGLARQVVGAGFVVPGFVTALLVALVALAIVMIAAVASAAVAVRQVSRMDASLVLKEGE